MIVSVRRQESMIVSVREVNDCISEKTKSMIVSVYQ